MRLPSPMRKYSLWRIAISPELDLGVVGGARRLQAVRANNASAEAVRRMKSLCEFQHKACFPLILRGTTVDKSFEGRTTNPQLLAWTIDSGGFDVFRSVAFLPARL